jgi:hypothetical protein
MRVRMMFCASAASIALAVSGCGGSSSNSTAQFKSSYNALRGPLNATGLQIEAELTRAPKQSNAQVQAAFQSLAQKFGSQVDQLGKLKPPSDLQADWNKVVQAGTRIEADLLAVAEAAKTSNPSLARQAGAAFTRNAAALQAAVAPIKAKLGLR